MEWRTGVPEEPCRVLVTIELAGFDDRPRKVDHALYGGANPAEFGFRLVRYGLFGENNLGDAIDTPQRRVVAWMPYPEPTSVGGG